MIVVTILLYHLKLILKCVPMCPPLHVCAHSLMHTDTHAHTHNMNKWNIYILGRKASLFEYV